MLKGISRPVLRMFQLIKQGHGEKPNLGENPPAECCLGGPWPLLELQLRRLLRLLPAAEDEALGKVRPPSPAGDRCGRMMGFRGSVGDVGTASTKLEACGVDVPFT